MTKKNLALTESNNAIIKEPALNIGNENDNYLCKHVEKNIRFSKDKIELE